MLSYLPEGAQQRWVGFIQGPHFLLLIIRPSWAYVVALSFGIRADLPAPLPRILGSTPFLCHYLHSGSPADRGTEVESEGVIELHRHSACFVSMRREVRVYHRPLPSVPALSLPPTLNNLEQHLPSCAWITWITSSKAALLPYNPLMIFPVTDSYCHISA